MIKLPKVGIVLTLFLVVVGFWLLFSTNPVEIIFDAPTKIMSEEVPDDYQIADPTKTKSSIVLKVAQSGDTAIILSEFYTKDLKVYKVKTPDEITGYIFSGDKFHDMQK